MDIDRWMAANRLRLNADKTELLWIGSKRNLSMMGGSDHSYSYWSRSWTWSHRFVRPKSWKARVPRLLQVLLPSATTSANPEFTGQWFCINTRSCICHYPRRLPVCNAIPAGSTKATTGRLQRVLNAAARVLSRNRKFDQGLHNLMHIDLHWLDVPEGVTYKLSVMVYHCLYGTAWKYLSELCTSVADVASRRQFQSASHNVLLVTRYKLSCLGRRAFRIAGPLIWLECHLWLFSWSGTWTCQFYTAVNDISFCPLLDTTYRAH